MIKALLLIFEPAATWDRIVSARRSLGFLLVIYLLPMLVIPSVIEGYGLMHFGEWQSQDSFAIMSSRDQVQRKRFFSVTEASVFEASQALLLILVLMVSAHVIRSLGDTFHSRHTFTQAFTVVVYALGPFFLLRVIDAFAISPWVAWVIGILLSMGILYHGVPRVMEPDPSHAFGLYLTSWLLLVLITGLWRLITAGYLRGGMPGLQKLVATLT